MDGNSQLVDIHNMPVKGAPRFDLREHSLDNNSDNLDEDLEMKISPVHARNPQERYSGFNIVGDITDEILKDIGDIAEGVDKKKNKKNKDDENSGQQPMTPEEKKDKNKDDKKLDNNFKKNWEKKIEEKKQNMKPQYDGTIKYSARVANNIYKIAQTLEGLASSFLEEIKVLDKDKEDKEACLRDDLSIIKEGTAHELMMDEKEIEKTRKSVFASIISNQMKRK